MEEVAGKSQTTLAGYLCTDVTGSTGFPGTFHTGLGSHVLFCQTAALVCDVDVFAPLLLCPGSVVQTWRGYMNF